MMSQPKKLTHGGENINIGSIFGTLLVVCGSVLLFWNEGSAIKVSLALEEGLKYITVPDTIEVSKAENENKLVLIGGNLAMKESLRDDAYGVSVNAVKLRKVVEVYQWKEIEHTSKVTVTDEHGKKVTKEEKSYTYEKDWFDHHIDSTLFNRDYGYQNPPKSVWPADSNTKTSNDVKIGGFILGSDLKDKMTDFTPLRNEELPTSAWTWVQLHDGSYYHARNIWNPVIGDYRVTFLCAGRAGDLFTVVGKQSNDEIIPYETVTGEELLILQSGLKDAKEVFMAEQLNNRAWTWVLRFLGWLLVFLGMFSMSRILEETLDPAVKMALTLGLANLSFSTSISVTLTTVGLGWISHYPSLGFCLILIGVIPYTIKTFLTPAGEKKSD